MRVILSRKGFDSKNGSIASPILPDGTLLSLPIPGISGKPYSELRYNGQTYKDIIEQLGGKVGDGVCHLDPDIRQGVFAASGEWEPAFGQSGAAQSVLKKQGVGAGDLFLFFGWFRQTELSGGKLKYTPKAPNLHVMYGYLQVGAILTDKTQIQKYSWHPHVNNGEKNNCLYIPAKTLSWAKGKAGYGVFPYNKKLVLTKDGMSRSCWALPDFFKPLAITWQRKDAWLNHPKHGEYYKSADIGQELVIEENPAVEKWAKSLF